MRSLPVLRAGTRRRSARAFPALVLLCAIAAPNGVLAECLPDAVNPPRPGEPELPPSGGIVVCTGTDPTGFRRAAFRGLDRLTVDIRGIVGPAPQTEILLEGAAHRIVLNDGGDLRGLGLIEGFNPGLTINGGRAERLFLNGSFPTLTMSAGDVEVVSLNGDEASAFITGGILAELFVGGENATLTMTGGLLTSSAAVVGDGGTALIQDGLVNSLEVGGTGASLTVENGMIGFLRAQGLGARLNTSGGTYFDAVEAAGIDVLHTNDATLPAGVLIAGTGAGLRNRGDIAGGGGSFAALVFGDDAHLVNELGSAIRTDGAGEDTIFVSGDDFELLNEGLIESTRSDADVIAIDADTGVTVVNNGTVRSTGSGSDAITASGRDIAFSNAGRVVVEGDDSAALAAESIDAILTNQLGGEIDVSGDRSAGIFVLGGGPVQREFVRNEGRIETTGTSAVGIAGAGPNLILTNSTGAEVTTTNADSHAISLGVEGFMNGRLSRVANAGSIRTEGARADGIHLFGPNNVIENTGEITVLGSDARGVNGIGNDLSILNDGQIAGGSDSNRAAMGIRIRGDRSQIDNGGSIEARGPGASGINVSGAGTTIRNGGAPGSLAAITLTGPDQIGIASFADGSLIENFGSIEGNGGFSGNFGIFVTGAPGNVQGANVRNDGAIAIAGAGAIAISVDADDAQIVQGDLTSSATATGTGATALRVSGSSFSVDNGGAIEALGANASGVHLMNASELLLGGLANAGSIGASGANAHAVRIEGGNLDLENDGEVVATGLGSVGISATHSGIVGTTVTNRGLLSGGFAAFVGSDAEDSFRNSGEVVGRVMLGGGDDVLTLAGGTFSVFGEPAAVTLDGGAGFDTLLFASAPGGPVDGALFVGFEEIGGGSDIQLTGDWTVDQVLVDGQLDVLAESFLAAGQVDVAAGGTLGGTGTIGRESGDSLVRVAAGGTLAPGLSPGRLTLAADLELEGVLEIEIGGTEDGSFDLIEVGGDLVLDTGLLRFVFIDDFRPTATDEGEFLVAEGASSGGVPGFEVFGLAAGFDFDVEIAGAVGGGIVGRLRTLAVPEPGLGMLLLVGLAFGSGTRRPRVRR